MKVSNDGNQFMVVLDRGEEVISTLQAFCSANDVHVATFSAIGAIERVRIGYYELGRKEYFFREESGPFEVASMNGNIALVDGAPFVHVHSVLSRCDDSGSVLGGHLAEAFVSVTLEVSLARLHFPMERKLDEGIGLKLLKLA